MQEEKQLVLITGATGRQGGAVARELLERGHRVRAMTRKPDGAPAKELAALGAEVVRGDLDDPASVTRALDGAWGTFAVQNTWEAGVEKEEQQGKRFAELARQAGVQHFVYTSVGSAHRSTGIPHFDNKARVEQRVRDLSFPSWVILRPAFFMENLVSPGFKESIDQGQLAMGIKPTTPLQLIAVADIGKYGALAFERPEQLSGRSIDLAGDERTMPQVAQIISDEARRPVSHFQVPIEQVRQFSDDVARMLEWFDAVGYNADITANEREFGIPATNFADWARRVTWN